MSGYLPMELRHVDTTERVVIGVAVPYNETTFLVSDPRGERIRRGAFKKSLKDRSDKIMLNLEHDGSRCVGRSVRDRWRDDDFGLVGAWRIGETPLGEETLTELRAGLWPSMSIRFAARRRETGPDGVSEVTEAELADVSLVRFAAYTGAEVLEVRQASPADIMATFGPRPDIDLSPLPSIW